MVKENSIMAVKLNPQAKVTLSGPALWLRLEGLTVLITAVVLYAQQEAGWLLFALLLLTPDLAMLPYLINPRLGALVYNVVHSYVLPLTLAAVAYVGGVPTLLPLALIWLAHIGMDRTAGYGLKYGDAFKHTHLQEV